MKGKARLRIILATLFLTATALHATDFGLELNNIGGLRKITDTTWYTDHKGTLWVTIPFDGSNDNSLAIEASAYAAKPADGNSYKFFADVDMFRFSLLAANESTFRMTVDLGRLPIVDITGMILNQTVDGAEFHLSFPFGNIDFLGSYTGLQNVRRTGANMTTDDFTESLSTDVYALGASRIIGKLTMQVPQLFGKMDLITEAVGQYDMRRYVHTAYDSTVDTVYGTIQISGPVQNNVFLTVSGTFQTGILDIDKQYSENSFLLSSRVDVYPSPKNQFYGQIVYTPGENSVLATFLPITYQSAGTLYTDRYTNLIRLSAGWFYNPKATLNFDLGGMIFFWGKEMISGEGLYRGIEISAGSSMKIAGDLKFRLDSKIYKPKDEDMRYQLSLKSIFAL